MNRMVAPPAQRAEFYLNLLSDRNSNVRKKAAEALGKVGDASILPRLEVQLKLEADAGVQAAIAEEVEKLRPAAIVPERRLVVCALGLSE